MLGPLQNDQTIFLLKQGLDSCALRHKLIANNIANAETPGFKISDIKFKDQVKRALEDKDKEKETIDMANTHEKHISPGPKSVDLSELVPQIIKINDTYRTEDGNNVDIDRQMSNLAENTIEFRAYQRSMGDMLSIITAAVRGE